MKMESISELIKEWRTVDMKRLCYAKRELQLLLQRVQMQRQYIKLLESKVGSEKNGITKR